MKQKDKVPQGEVFDVVYQISCSDCDQVYSETTHKLKVRVQQNRNNTSEANLAKPVLTSALAKHTKDTNHIFDFALPKILDRHHNKRKLQLSKVTHIIMNQENACNFKTDGQHIAPTYCNVLCAHAGKTDLDLPPITTRC